MNKHKGKTVLEIGYWMLGYRSSVEGKDFRKPVKK